MTGSFFPAPSISHGWIQTLGAAVPFWAPPGYFAPQERERLRLPVPGTESALHAHAWWHRDRERHATVLLVHGVGGSAEAAYLVRAAVALYDAGYHVVRLDLRGAGTSADEWDSRYHAGLSSDVVAACKELSRHPRVGDLALAGFSLGGHLALHVSADAMTADVGKLKAVIALAAPLELAATVKYLQRPAALPFHGFVVLSLVAQTFEMLERRPELIPCTRAELLRVRSLWDYDDLVVARMHGFLGARDYYERSSVAPRLRELGRPTLYLYADDDPMVPASVAEAVLGRGVAPNLSVEHTARGGHLGWFARADRESFVRSWPIERIRRFLERELRPRG
jgi:predicted alpha/beta-fold hydrolase